MYESDNTAVMRCELCNKPFDKQSTLKRHGYYCRARKGGNTVRPRSCVACAKGKARCDNKRPECTRCSAKLIPCQYPALPRKKTDPSKTGSSLTAGSSHFQTSPESDVEATISLDTSFVASDSTIENFDWDIPELGFSEFLNMPVNEEDMDEDIGNLMGDVLPLPDTSLIRRTTPSTDPTIHIPSFAIPTAANLVIPPVPPSDRRSLIPRSNSKAGPQRAVTLILHMLKSYPQMMLRDSTLPPYIHPYFMSPEFSGGDMESLHNCVNLMRMISYSVQGSRKLFWKNVKLECERFIADAVNMNHRELLAVMFALSIYILLRMSEGETEFNNFDNLLLTAMTATAKQLTLSDLTYAPLTHTCDTRACWIDWLYMESRRRLGVVFRVINLIVYFDPGAMCSLQSDLLVAPLPTKKVLWEARDEFTWKSERDKQRIPRTAFGLATNGGMVRLDEMDLHGGYGSIDPKEDSNTSEQNWEEWLSGIDAFGGLIVLAASLVG